MHASSPRFRNYRPDKPHHPISSRHIIYIRSRNSTIFFKTLKFAGGQQTRILGGVSLARYGWKLIVVVQPLSLWGELHEEIIVCCLLAMLGLTSAATPGRSQEEVLSPPAKAACKFADGNTITVIYSSPRMRGRKIFGDLVPFDEVWRTGADDATAFLTTSDLVAGEKVIPAAKYTLFTLPTQNKWTLIISKQTGEFGIPYPGERFDFARLAMKVSKLPSPVENFTISFDQAGKACTMKLDWETTRTSIDFSEKK